MTKAIALTGPSGAVAPPSPTGKQGRPQMDKATLKLYDPAPAAGGGGEPGGEIDSIPFQFNPKEVTISKSAKWERKPAKGAKKAGPPEFSGSEPCKLSLEMFFDATGKHDGSVVAAVEKLFTCCVPTASSVGQKKASPPLVVLQWGKITSFPAFVTQVSAKYTLFAADGTPIRAVVTAQMEEMPGDPLKQNPTSGALSVRRMHRVVEGDTLASLAHGEYGDAALWRSLASYNGIDDPLRLPQGVTVLLPSVEDLAIGG